MLYAFIKYFFDADMFYQSNFVSCAINSGTNVAFPASHKGVKISFFVNRS